MEIKIYVIYKFAFILEYVLNLNSYIQTIEVYLLLFRIIIMIISAIPIIFIFLLFS